MSRDHALIIKTSKCIPSLSTFLAKAKVRPNSFAGKIFTDIYTQLFVTSINLSFEYQQWHSTEYSSFTDFVRRKYKILLSEANAGESYYLIDSWLVFLEKDYEHNILEKCLELVGGTSEI